MRILIAGLGGIGQRHARNLRALLGNQLELVAWRVRGLRHVVTPTLDADSARDVEKEFGIVAFDDLSEALQTKPDAAYICNPTSLHVLTAMECARAGCALFLEKPISDRLNGLSDLLALVDAKRIPTMTGYQLRFHPCFQTLTEWLPQITPVLAVRASIGEYLPNWHRYEDYRQMYAARSELGGGVVLSQIHELDYLYALFGLPRRVFSLGGHWSNLEIDVEDVASTLMDYSAGGRSFAVHLHQDYVQRPPARVCEVIGERGTITADFAALEVTTSDKTLRFAGFDRNQLFLEQTKCFLRCVRGEAQPPVDLRGGIASLIMALAVKESIASGQPVNLQLEH